MLLLFRVTPCGSAPNSTGTSRRYAVETEVARVASFVTNLPTGQHAFGKRETLALARLARRRAGPGPGPASYFGENPHEQTGRSGSCAAARPSGRRRGRRRDAPRALGATAPNAARLGTRTNASVGNASETSSFRRESPAADPGRERRARADGCRSPLMENASRRAGSDRALRAPTASDAPTSSRAKLRTDGAPDERSHTPAASSGAQARRTGVPRRGGGAFLGEHAGRASRRTVRRRAAPSPTRAHSRPSRPALAHGMSCSSADSNGADVFVAGKELRAPLSRESGAFSGAFSSPCSHFVIARAAVHHGTSEVRARRGDPEDLRDVHARALDVQRGERRQAAANADMPRVVSRNAPSHRCEPSKPAAASEVGARGARRRCRGTSARRRPRRRRRRLRRRLRRHRRRAAPPDPPARRR